MGSRRGFVCHCGCGGCVCIIALFEGCFLAVVDSFDQVRAFDRALFDQIARLLLACDGMQRDEGLIGLRQRFDHGRERRRVPGIVSHHRHIDRLDGGRRAHGLEHEVEDRGEDDGKDERPYDGARREQEPVHRRFEGSPHIRPLVAQLAAGDFEEHIVQGGRGARDAAQARLARAQRCKHVGEVVLARLARDGE